MDSGSALNSEKVELKAARNLRATNTSAQQLWHLKVAMFYKEHPKSGKAIQIAEAFKLARIRCANVMLQKCLEDVVVCC